MTITLPITETLTFNEEMPNTPPNPIRTTSAKTRLKGPPLFRDILREHEIVPDSQKIRLLLRAQKIPIRLN